MNDTFGKQLRSFLLTPYPYLYLVTHEEERTLGLLRAEAEALGMTFSCWRPEEHAAPSEALDEVCASLAQSPEGRMVVALDAYPYLGDEKRIRKLRVLAEKLQQPRSMLIFVSPLVVRPPALFSDWVVLDVPLPERAQLEAELVRILPPEQFPSISREALSASALGLTRKEAIRAFARVRALWKLEGARPEDFDWEAALVHEKRRLINEVNALEFYDLTVGLKDLGGLDELKRWMFERRGAFSEKARQYGLPMPKGVLLLGVQGCGKSLAAKAIAGYWGFPLLRFDLGAVFSSGSAPDVILQRALRTAESMAPSILWLDEIEKGFEDASGSETQRLLGSLLVWLQEKKQPVFFVATANQVKHLPPELLRRGRFDEIFFVDLPDEEARQDILKIHLNARGRDPAQFDLKAIAESCENHSGAELEQVIVAALYHAFAREQELSQKSLLLAARQMIPLYNMYEEEIKALRTWARDRARMAARQHRLADYFKQPGAGPPAQAPPAKEPPAGLTDLPKAAPFPIKER